MLGILPELRIWEVHLMGEGSLWLKCLTAKTKSIIPAFFSKRILCDNKSPQNSNKLFQTSYTWMTHILISPSPLWPKWLTSPEIRGTVFWLAERADILLMWQISKYICECISVSSSGSVILSTALNQILISAVWKHLESLSITFLLFLKCIPRDSEVVWTKLIVSNFATKHCNIQKSKFQGKWASCTYTCESSLIQSSEYFRNDKPYLLPHLRFSFTVLIAKSGLKDILQEDGRKMGKGDVGDVVELGLTNTLNLVKAILLLSLKSQVILAPGLGEKKENCRPPTSTLHKVSIVLLSLYSSPLPLSWTMAMDMLH